VFVTFVFVPVQHATDGAQHVLRNLGVPKRSSRDVDVKLTLLVPVTLLFRPKAVFQFVLAFLVDAVFEENLADGVITDAEEILVLSINPYDYIS
jgi:hypothetical protein